MTTAHRPTFHPARGGTGRTEGDLSKLSQQYSSKDMPSHTKLKYRQTGQGTEDELRRRVGWTTLFTYGMLKYMLIKDLRRELEEKEKNASRDRRSRDSAAPSSSSKRARLEEITHAGVDADEPLDEVFLKLFFFLLAPNCVARFDIISYALELHTCTNISRLGRLGLEIPTLAPFRLHGPEIRWNFLKQG